MFVINLDSFENLGPQLLAEKQQLESLQVQLGSEANASDANMTTLLKVNRDLRKELESLEEGSQGAEDELGFLLPKIKSLQDQTSKIEKELKEANAKVESIEAKMEPEDQRIDTLTQQKEEVLVQLEEVSIEYTKAENDWRILDQNLSSLSRVREAALETYQNARKSLLEEISNWSPYNDKDFGQIDSSLPISKGVNETLCLEILVSRGKANFKLHAVLSFAQNPQSTQKGKQGYKTSKQNEKLKYPVKILRLRENENLVD